MKALQAWILSKKYTADTADSLGSLKGAPCEVTDIETGETTTIITLQWEGTSGQIQSGTVTLPNGEKGDPGEKGDDGRGIKSMRVRRVGDEDHLIITYDDDTTEDAGKITGGGGGSAELEDDLTTSVAVGGIKSGTTYEEGTSLETLFRDMLNPVANPTLTNPSATLSATGAKLLETGATLSTTFTIAFNRGSINPAYGTSGYRSGVASSYTFDGDTGSATSFPRTITSAKTSYQGSVAYETGEQPKNSVGGNYSTPLPAGSVNTNTITYEFVNALWANTASIATIAKLALVSKSTKLKQFDFPAQTVANPEVFDVPATWTITAVEVLNTLSNQWEDCSAEFAITDTTHDDAGGVSTAYKRYTCALGYATGARKIRIKWS